MDLWKKIKDFLQKMYPPDKEDNKHRLDSAEEKHYMLLKRLEKQQEQLNIIIEQQNQITEQLKDYGGCGGAAAIQSSDGPSVINKLEVTKEEIADANRIPNQVAAEVTKSSNGPVFIINCAEGSKDGRR